MAALDSAHVALALGCPTVLVARMSSGEERERHRGISHHTLTVLDLLLEPVTVALPAGMRSPVGADLRAGLGDVFGGGADEPSRAGARGRAARARHAPRLAPGARRPARLCRQRAARVSMGRTLTQDPLFFGAALAGGTVLAELASTPAEGGDGAVSARDGGTSADERAFEPAGGETVYSGRSSTSGSSASATRTVRRSRARSSATAEPSRS